jgi:hypothetical protein
VAPLKTFRISRSKHILQPLKCSGNYINHVFSHSESLWIEHTVRPIRVPYASRNKGCCGRGGEKAERALEDIVVGDDILLEKLNICSYAFILQAP